MVILDILAKGLGLRVADPAYAMLLVLVIGSVAFNFKGSAVVAYGPITTFAEVLPFEDSIVLLADVTFLLHVALERHNELMQGYVGHDNKAGD